MRNIGEPWDRQCPDCSESFVSVQSTGVCPSCELVFDVDRNGKLLRRRHHIGDAAPPKPSPAEVAIKGVRKYLRVLDAAKITADEFNDNLLLHWVDMPRECWDECASEIPENTARQFAYFLDKYLVPVAFRPSPTCFMVGPFETERIEQKKLELEPVYREIHGFWLRHTLERGITMR
ncbi:MAG: hypothetical protein F9B45_26935 [Phycisphaera sp. RhM]|nr:hypothetical protein [Phycisphaera sp. RhM]